MRFLSSRKNVILHSLIRKKIASIIDQKYILYIIYTLGPLSSKKYQKTLILAFDTIKSDFPNCTFPQNFRALCIGIYGNSTVLLNISQEGTFPKWDSCILDWIWARSMGFLVEHLQRLMVMIWIEWYTGPEKEILQLIFVLVILCVFDKSWFQNAQNN
jgi:hypothetical protein